MDYKNYTIEYQPECCNKNCIDEAYNQWNNMLKEMNNVNIIDSFKQVQESGSSIKPNNENRNISIPKDKIINNRETLQRYYYWCKLINKFNISS